MTVAIVTLAAVVAGALGVIVWLARSRSLLFDDLEACASERLMYEARADDMEDERNAAIADAVKARTEATLARAALVQSQAAERAAREEKANALAAIAQSASSDQLFELANRLLGTALPGQAPGVAPTGDLGDTGPIAKVQPTDAADPGAAGSGADE